MKKSFMFVAVAAAGMLASCSSESLTGSDPKIPTPDQEELVPIEIGVASSETKGTTRGTGTVGGVDDASNKWKGEKVTVLMYKIDSNGNPTFNFATDGATPTPSNLYDETMFLVTPLATESKVSGLAKEISDGDPYVDPNTAKYKLKYYPSTGRFDFWGFYLGGGNAKPSDAVATPTLNDVIATYDDQTTPTANNAKAVDFVLDGTMDLMVAKAATGAENSTSPENIAVGNVPFTENQTNAVTDDAIYASSYSAKSARGGLQPDLLFKHALTRLTFKVKAGNANAKGVQIKAIKVHSMTTGKLVVAYDYTQGNISAANSIIWDNAYDPTTDFTTDTDENGLFDYQEDYPALSLKELDNTNGMQDLTAYTLAAADVLSAHAIGEALLVAPQQKYWLEVEYDATAATAAEWKDPTATTGGSSISPAPITADIKRSTSTDVFEAGKSYNVTITLYGPEKIEITTSLQPWTNVDEEISIVGE